MCRVKGLSLEIEVGSCIFSVCRIPDVMLWFFKNIDSTMCSLINPTAQNLSPKQNVILNLEINSLTEILNYTSCNYLVTYKSWNLTRTESLKPWTLNFYTYSAGSPQWHNVGLSQLVADETWGKEEMEGRELEVETEREINRIARERERETERRGKLGKGGGKVSEPDWWIWAGRCGARS